MGRLAFLLVLAPALAGAQAVPDEFFFEKDRLRVLIVTGRNNHDWRATTPFLRRVLDAAGKFDVRVTEEPGSLSAESLRPYDALVINYCGPRWSSQTEKAVEDFVRGGKGMVVIHAADYPFGELPVLGEKMTNTKIRQKPWPEWAKMVGARWSEAEPRTGHGTRHAYRVTWKDMEHPIARGLERDFLISDELYHNFRLEPGIHILAAAFDAKQMRGTGKEEPLIWTVAYGKGRVFHTALGHDVDAMQAPGFVVSYARGVEWAARAAVTLPATISLNPKDKDAVRVLLVTGGHDHEASFYAIFEGHRNIRVNVDPHPVAFRKDLRKDYDVIVLYDSVQELPEVQRKNLRAFVESGKGLVALHHAVVDLTGWEWWWREVIGGLYVLKAMPGMPASTYLHDVEMVVNPVGSHPIVKDLPQMRLYDETYKQVWLREGVEPLLTADHPTSDKVIGWIGPCTTSKVVVLQPGHGRESHESPWYRTLVSRAVLWSAGRL
ncbi:MAG: ThuA domain-containing protein [Bryobacteraceae bacterium]|nr:ThuA domain-containing protein [Bryobacteraceae bacterium]